MLILGSDATRTASSWRSCCACVWTLWYVAALVSWGIALFEYLLQVPANRIGHTQFNVAQLKILQEVITLLVFLPFAILYMHQQIRLNYLWAGLCLVGSVYFMFRS